MLSTYNIHLDRAKLLNSELISVVKELAELNVGFEEFALFQVQEISIPESVTLKASGSWDVVAAHFATC